MPQFRAKARAVDLLGKGQIADLPTAISELWKNGYDAYGDLLEAFLYAKGYQDHQQPVFVLTDDGKGMTREDILDKWFVLGTDSKSRIEPDEKGSETLWKEPRIKMGEKGIGRLSVAYLGPQMLMLTKKRNYPLEAVFFDWRVLDNYNLFLEDINIPLRTVGSENTNTFFQELKEEFLGNFSDDESLRTGPWKDQPELKTRIIQECKDLSLPDYIYEDFIRNKRFGGSKTNGTVFIIFQPDPQILDLENSLRKDGMDDLADNQSINHSIATLVGLFNLFKTYKSVHETKFWIIEKSGARYDLLTLREFFEPDDFNDSDHAIEGRFDEFGEFTGKVRIYNQTVSHLFNPLRYRKGKTHYGPFNIRLGYVQARQDETIVNPERKRIFESKLEFYSGLFIYRDGFRVLPYGRPDTDFLEFEERRSKSLGDNFFSKRRMFGYLEISRITNSGLIDKSSREGFINNAAYRDFRLDLIDFFKDLSKKYFGSNATSDIKSTQQEELEKLSEAAKEEHQRDIEERKKFARAVNQLPKELEQLQQELTNSTQLLRAKSADSTVPYEEIQPILNTISQLKVRYTDLRLAKPTRFKPTDLQKKKFAEYQKQYAGFSKIIKDADRATEDLKDKLKLFELFSEFENGGNLYRNTLANRFEEYGDRSESIFRKMREQLELERQSFLSEYDEKYQSVTPAKDNAEDIYRSMQLLENIFNELKNRITERIGPYLEHLERFSPDVNEDNLVGYFKDQFEEMKKEWEQTYELAQLGIAVEIIDHQFSTLYSGLSENIKSLQEYLTDDRAARNKYELLVNAFNHLEDNYKLLQPLYRTTGKIPKDVTGRELYDYLKDFFRDTLADNSIKFTITSAAETWSVYSYESIFKPVLINIINNAVFWLQTVEKREIIMDVKDGALLVLNSGLPIDDMALEDIFKLFYSQRSRGRGIGLFLARRSLNGIGFEITASNDPANNYLKGACFVIKPIKP